MKQFLYFAGIAFSIALAVVIGTRMTSDAMAVIIGIIFGVLSSVPTSLLLVWVLRQRDKQIESQLNSINSNRYSGQYPPVVVVNGQGTNGYNGFASPTSLGATPARPRNFKVIGQEKTETKGDSLPPLWDNL